MGLKTLKTIWEAIKRAVQVIRNWRYWIKPAVTCGGWAYLGVVVAICLTIRIIGERWLPATLLMFGPRWVVALPALPLIVLAVALRRRTAAVVTSIAAIVVAWPLMGFCIPWARLSGESPSAGAFHLRVVTFNAHEQSLPRDRRAWDEMIRTAKPDVITLEEWRGGPSVTGAGGSWYGLDDGELRLESRYPLRRVASLFQSERKAMGSATQFEVQTPAGAVPLIVVHLASPHGSFRDAVQLNRSVNPSVAKNTNDRKAQAAVTGLAAKELGTAVIVAGDFNLPSDSRTFRQSFAGLVDAFSNDGGLGFGWTYSTRSTAVRIDHVLAGGSWQCKRSWVGPNVGSPHRPLIADLQLVRPRLTEK